MQTKYPFYNQHVRKSIVAFGTLFKNVVIVRKDKDKKTQQIIKVPLTYGPKEKFITRSRDESIDLNKDILGQAAKMTFEISGFQYDPTRKLNVINRVNTVAEGVGKYRQYTPVPYNIGINLYILTTLQEDALQIIEQILPYFGPSFNLSVNMVPEMGIKQDIPVVLNSVQVNDNWDTQFNQNRQIIYTLSFSIKLNFHGPIAGRIDTEKHFDGDGTNKKQIKKVQTNLPNEDEAVLVNINPIDAEENENYEIEEYIGVIDDINTAREFVSLVVKDEDLTDRLNQLANEILPTDLNLNQ